MKNKMLLIASVSLMFACFSSAQAQYLGAKLGYTSATLAGKDITNAEKRNSMSAGLFALFPLNPLIALQAHATISARGALQPVQDNGQTYDAGVRLNYFDLPVLVTLHIPAGDAPVRPMLFSGPCMSFLVSAKADELIPGQGLTEIDLKDATQETDLSWIFGGGLGVPVGKNLLTFSVQYAIGMSTIDKSVENAFDVKNRMLSFEIGFGFGIGEK